METSVRFESPELSSILIFRNAEGELLEDT